MSKTMAIPEDLYEWLESEAKRRNVASIDLVLVDMVEQKKREDKRRRDEAIQRILDLHERMAAKYGLVDDSTDLIRQDRER